MEEQELKIVCDKVNKCDSFYVQMCKDKDKQIEHLKKALEVYQNLLNAYKEIFAEEQEEVEWKRRLTEEWKEEQNENK